MEKMLKLGKGTYTGNINTEIAQHNVLVSIIHYQPDQVTTGLHYHENPHLCLLLQGCDKELRKGVSYVRTCGELYFYPAGDAHATVSQKQLTKSLVIEFEDSFLKKNNLSESLIETVIRQNPTVKLKLLKLLCVTGTDGSCQSIAIESLIFNLFSCTEHFSVKKIPAWLKQVDECTRENWDQPFSLEDLSAITGVHPVTISKYFSYYFHCTLSEYIRKLRIEKSIPLIKNTTMRLTEIAYQCGFSDQSHFIRIFKDTTGFLPNELRKL